MTDWVPLTTAGVLPLALGLRTLASMDGRADPPIALRHQLAQYGTDWRARECVDRLVEAEYAHHEVADGPKPRGRRLILAMTPEGWQACRRLGVEKW